VIIAAIVQQTHGLEDTRALGLTLLYFLSYKPNPHYAVTYISVQKKLLCTQNALFMTNGVTSSCLES